MARVRREFCDRCGIEGGTKAERTARNVPKVVRVTWVPLARVMDLCGPCRKMLDEVLDGFLDHDDRRIEVAPGVWGTPPDERLPAPPDDQESRRNATRPTPASSPSAPDAIALLADMGEAIGVFKAKWDMQTCEPEPLFTLLARLDALCGDER